MMTIREAIIICDRYEYINDPEQLGDKSIEKYSGVCLYKGDYLNEELVDITTNDDMSIEYIVIKSPTKLDGRIYDLPDNSFCNTYEGDDEIVLPQSRVEYLEEVLKYLKRPADYIESSMDLIQEWRKFVTGPVTEFLEGRGYTQSYDSFMGAGQDGDLNMTIEFIGKTEDLPTVVMTYDIFTKGAYFNAVKIDQVLDSLTQNFDEWVSVLNPYYKQKLKKKNEII